jgi:hypothetical protein
MTKNPSGAGAADIAIECVFPAGAVCRGMSLDACKPFDRIAVKTRRSDYELVVVDGKSGEVLVRGGQYFGDFQRAWLTGSILGASAIKVRTIVEGCPLEFRVDRTSITTSPVESVSRAETEDEGATAM